MNKQLEIYKKYFIENNFKRLGSFELLRDQFNIESALYLGSFVHITPAFIFPKTCFVDSDRRIKKFFSDKEIKNYINKNKQYSGKPDFIGMQQNYEKSIPLEKKSFDLLISQYAGFVSQAGKKYLKSGGKLYTNNSHGDASMAYLDNDYEFIGVINNSNGKWTYRNENLSGYFIPKKGIHPTKVEIKSEMKGIGYTKSSTGYIFQLKN